MEYRNLTELIASEMQNKDQIKDQLIRLVKRISIYRPLSIPIVQECHGIKDTEKKIITTYLNSTALSSVVPMGLKD